MLGAVAVVVYCVIALNPWALHIGGQWTPFMYWTATGKLITSGGTYPLLVTLYPSTHSSHVRLDGLRPISGLQGQARLRSGAARQISMRPARRTDLPSETPASNEPRTLANYVTTDHMIGFPQSASAPRFSPHDRESFFDAQRRNRHATWRLSAVTVIATIVMGIPLALTITPLLYAAGLITAEIVSAESFCRNVRVFTSVNVCGAGERARQRKSGP